VNKKSRKKDRGKKATNLRKRTCRGVEFCSFLEADVARYLCTCRIKWERNTLRFPCVIDGKTKYYCPDFYLPTYDLYLESKGIFHSEDKKEKTYEAVRQNNLNWIIVFQKEFRENNHIVKERIDSFIGDNHDRTQ